VEVKVTQLRSERRSFGAPGIEPRWTHGDKDAVGTAYSSSSRVWFTVSNGVLNEIYFPTLDRPQIRDLQFLMTDGETFFHDERRHLDSTIEYLGHHSLGVRIVSSDRERGYRLVKEVITDPHQPTVLVRTRLSGRAKTLRTLRLYVLVAPHLEVGGWENTGNVADLPGRTVLTAHTSKGQTWLALGATIPFTRSSCGFVGTSDGWTDLAENLQMDWSFDTAENGNIALMGELDLRRGREFTLAVAFGNNLHSAVTTLSQSLGFPFAGHRRRFHQQWARVCQKVEPLEKASTDGGELYHVSHSLLLAHEDKSYQGAMIASLSIPWGQAKSDADLGGYHLVWTRDMVNSATGLLAAGNVETPLRALIYLACSQQADGGFAQNFWLNGDPYWQGIQLDEVAFPILLAWRLHVADALQDFDPYPMVKRAAGYLVREGPATPQERWEENSGYSPSTLASNIAALCCAACFARERGDEATAGFLQEYADFLECHIERWTVTDEGKLVAAIPRHFIRIHPVRPDDVAPDEDPNHGVLTIRNRPPGTRAEYPSKEIVDAGFLELVRYGIRRAGDPLFEDSLAVVDEVLKVETPVGPCWHRYNHDGYGERSDGGPFLGSGKGRAWPLLSGERAHYELAAGHDVEPFVRALEGFATKTGLLPEQVWDEPDRPEIHMFLGRPTGAAMPLMWAHAEYVKLLRSRRDDAIFDSIPAVAEHYLSARDRLPLEIWKPNRQVRSVKPGMLFRVQSPARFRLRFTSDEWRTVEDAESTPTKLGIEFFDIQVPPEQRAPIRFTFFWTADAKWEGRDYRVDVEP